MKSYIYILIFGFFYFCSTEVEARASLFSNEKLVENRGSEILKTLRSKHYRCVDVPKEAVYLKQLYKEAVRFDSMDVAEYAAAELVRYYYNLSKKDSLHYWLSKIEEIAKTKSVHSSRYFMAYGRSCRLRIWIEQDEQAANEAIQLYHLALSEKNTEGMVVGCETLGFIYKEMKLDSLSLRYFHEGLELLEQIKPRQTSWLAQFRFFEIEALLKMHDPKKLKKAIDAYKQLIEELAMDKDSFQKKIPVERCRFFYECCFMRYYVMTHNLTQATVHKANADRLLPQVKNEYVLSKYKLGLCYYFKAKKQLKEALTNVNELLKKSYSAEYLSLKAALLSEEGKSAEANQIYKELITAKQKEYETSYIRQVKMLSNLNDETQRTLEKDREVIDRKQWQLLMLAGTLIFLLTLFLVVSIYTYKLRKTKKSLLERHHDLLRTQKLLKEAKSKAEQSERLKTLFLANMSHEIRTPLNAIVGFSSILTDRDSNELTGEEKETYSYLIEQNADSLIQLVNDVLDVSDLEAESCKFHYAEVELGGCCRMVASVASYQAGENVKVNFSPTLEPFTFYTDQSRLEQVFKNLLSNAIKFTKEGSIDLSYAVDQQKKEVRFAITDTGIGIPQEKQAMVFSHFVKMDDYMPGAGLGLSICSLVVKRFEGQIYVDSNYKGGTRIVFTHKLFTEEEIKNKE
ncbi:MAG: ATP-binding protein [Bacteroidaceae bacterium]